MSSKTDQDAVYLDRIGQEVRVGSIVATPSSISSITICRVIAITPKSFRVEYISGGGNTLKRRNEVICLDEMEATVMYLMTRNL